MTVTKRLQKARRTNATRNRIDGIPHDELPAEAQACSIIAALDCALEMSRRGEEENLLDCVAEALCMAEDLRIACADRSIRLWA